MFKWMENGGRGKRTNFWSDLGKIIAYYPLTFYIGLTIISLSALLVYLQYTIQWQFSYETVVNWVKDHQTILLSLALLLLGTTLFASALSYKRVCNLSQQDYLIWLQQRSTRTLFPFLTPLHDWLRLRFAFYRWWHTQVVASTIHVILLLTFLGFSLSYFVPNEQTTLLSPGGNEGSATYLKVTGITDPTQAGVVRSVTVEALFLEFGEFETRATDYRGTVHFTSTDAQATLPADYTFTAGDAGIHTFTNQVTMKTAGEQSVTAETLGSSPPVTGSQTAITVTAAAVASLTVSGITTPTTAGTARSVTVTAKDAYSNTVTSYTGTITFTSSDAQATLPSNYTFVGGDSGTKTFASGVTLKTAGTQSVTATQTGGGGITGSQTGIVVNPASVASFTVSGITTPTTAGTARSVTVTAKDAYSNTVTSYTGTITFTSSDAQATLPSNYTFVGGDSGTKTFASGVTLKTSGTQSVTATQTGGGGITGSQTGIVVNPSTVASFTVSGITTPTTAGTARSVTVTAKDAYSNTVTSYTGTIAFTSSDAQATLPSNYTFVGGDSGTKTFASGVTLKTAGTQSVTATQTGGGGITGSQTGIVVNPSTVASFTVSGITTPTTAGTARSVTVTAKDAYSNTVTSYTGTIAFTSSDAQATLPSNYTFVGGDSGTKTFASGVTLKTAGTQSVTATQTGGGGITGSQTGIVVNPAAATSLTVSGITTPTTAGTVRSVTVTAKDDYSNTATSYTGTVTFTSSDAQATLPSNYTFVGGDSGTKTFTNEVTLKTAGTQSVTATDTVTGTITGTQSSIVVNPASATTLEVTGIASPTTAGTARSVTVTALDDYDNTATGYTGTVTFTSSDAQAILPSNYTFVGGDSGSKTFTNEVTLKTAGTQSVTATDTVTGTITGTQSGIVVNPGSASVLEITNTTSPITAGDSQSPTVTLYDAYSNVATGYTGTVDFTSSDSQATLPSNYTFVGGDTGTKTFTSGVILKTSGTKSIVVTDTVNGALTDTVLITVNHASAASLELTNVSASVNAGTQLSPTITIKDDYSNTVTGYTGTVEFTSSDAQATLPSNYTFVGGDAGTKTFTNQVVLKTVGTKSVTVTDTITSSLTDSVNVAVFNASATVLIATTPTTNLTVGDVFPITVELTDDYGNRALDYEGEITFSSNDVAAVLPDDYIFPGAVAPFDYSGISTFSSLSLNTAGTITVTITDIIDSNITDSIVFTVASTGGGDDGGGSGGGGGGGSDDDPDTGGGTTNPPNDDDPDTGGGSNTPIQNIPKIVKDAVKVVIERVTESDLRQPLTYAAAASSALGLITFAPFASAVINWITSFTINGASLFNLSMLSIVRSRRKKWGRVESALTGKPVPGVFVELYSEGKLIDRILTDKSGEFAFLVEKAGKYNIQIQNPLYEPYISEKINIEFPNQDVIKEYIILHPIEEKMIIRLERALKVIRFIEILRLIQWPVLIVGLVLAALLIASEFTYFRLFVLFTYVIAWGLKLYEIKYRRPFGVVTDRISNEPQPLAVAQLETIDENRGKIVRSTITDKFGRFVFIVKKNTYRLNIAKIGYVPKEVKIDGENINLDVRLDRQKVG